jgi:hypothetical protein
MNEPLRNLSPTWQPRLYAVCLGILIIILLCPVRVFAETSRAPQFSIAFTKQRSDKPLDGRMLLLLSTDPSEEPRMQINDTPRTQMVFGIDIDGLKPEESVFVDEKAWGYPLRSLRDVPPG